MLLKSLAYLIALQACIFSISSATSILNQPCFTKRTPSIPECHIYHSKRKPLVIGHRGNPLKYQENSLAGFKSLTRTRADGFEVDVFLTKDKKLVCFHDDDTLRLTGKSGKIQDMTSTQIRRLRYKNRILYGTQTFHYNTRRKIAFLHELLTWARRTNLLLFIEIKPQTPILSTAAAVQNSIATGTAVAKMVKAFGMANQVILLSFDSLAISTAKKVDSCIVIGTLTASIFWRVPSSLYVASKSQLLRLYPSTAQCINPVATTDNSYITHLYLSGVTEKAIGAAVLFLGIEMFDNPAYGTRNTIRTLRRNYSSSITIGAYTAYDMSLTPAAQQKLEKALVALVRKGSVHIFITDNIGKMARKVRRYRPRSKWNRYGDDRDNEEEVNDENEDDEGREADADDTIGEHDNEIEDSYRH